jgi:hypothetical protein
MVIPSVLKNIDAAIKSIGGPLRFFMIYESTCVTMVKRRRKLYSG